MVCDRFVDSSRAYQGGAGGLGDEAILALHAIGSGGLLPDLTLLIEIVARSSRAARSPRATATTATRSAGAMPTITRAVAAAFARFAAAEPDRFARIDGDGDAERGPRAGPRRRVAPLLEAAA